MSRHIIVYYGPVNSYNLGTAYKPQLLYGLRDQLRRLGYRVDLRPVECINYCMLEMSGYEIFKCNMKYLCCNTHYKKDATANLALKAVEDATQKFYYARTHSWLKEYIIAQFYKTSEYSYKDHWFTDIPDVQQMADLDTCAAECCEILYRRKRGGKETKLESEQESECQLLLDDISKAFSHGGKEFTSRLIDNSDEGKMQEIEKKATAHQNGVEPYKIAIEEAYVSELQKVEKEVVRKKDRRSLKFS